MSAPNPPAQQEDGGTRCGVPPEPHRRAMPKQPKYRPTKGERTRRDVLRLWAQGLTTKQIADVIDCSSRHVRRIKAAYRADYESRCETGATYALWEEAS